MHAGNEQSAPAPRPADQKLLIETEHADRPEEIANWAQEIENAASTIPEEDHQSFLAALEEQNKVSKQQVRKQLGLLE